MFVLYILLSKISQTKYLSQTKASFKKIFSDWDSLGFIPHGQNESPQYNLFFG